MLVDEILHDLALLAAQRDALVLGAVHAAGLDEVGIHDQIRTRVKQVTPESSGQYEKQRVTFVLVGKLHGISLANKHTKIT